MNSMDRFKCLLQQYKLQYRLFQRIQAFQTDEQIHNSSYYFRTETLFHKIVDFYGKELEKTKYNIEAQMLIDELVDEWIADEYLSALSGIICLYSGVRYNQIEISIHDILFKRNTLQE